MLDAEVKMLMHVFPHKDILAEVTMIIGTETITGSEPDKKAQPAVLRYRVGDAL